MSSSHDTHAEHGNAPDHVPHVLPLKTYFVTWGTLVFLTAATVGVSYINFGAANLFIAMLIATIKASVVALVFMHLWFDHKFHSMIIAMSVLFLAIFICFTMFDTEARGRAEEIEGQRPQDMVNPFKGTRQEAVMKASYGISPSASAMPSSSFVAPGTEAVRR